MRKKLDSSIALSAQLIELGGTVPTEIKLLPAGKFRAKDGRPEGLAGWVMNDASAHALLSASTDQTDKYLIDYDHQTLHSKVNGQQAPAAGWFAELAWRPYDGLYAVDVEWTAAASAAIEAKEYRYISPVLRYNPATGEVTGLLMAALVNYPALDGLNDLAAAHFILQPTQALSMDIDELIEQARDLLNLPLLATDTDILAEIDKLKTLIEKDIADDATETSGESLSVRLAQAQTIQADLSAQFQDPEQFVPVAVVAALQTELADLSALVKAENISKLINPALADGRLLPGQKDWAQKLGESNFESLAAYLETAQPIAALLGTQTSGLDPDETTAPAYKPLHGYSVDSDQEALHAKILAHAHLNNIDYQTAALAVGA